MGKDEYLGAVEKTIDGFIDDLAKDVLYDIAKHEISALANRNPTFDELALECKRILVGLEEQLGQEQLRNKIVSNFKELVEILHQTAEAVTTNDTKLLSDCVTHLEEFLDIRANGGHL